MEELAKLEEERGTDGYVSEDRRKESPQFHIIAAGSLLGIALHEGTSFPVGKVDFCNYIL